MPRTVPTAVVGLSLSFALWLIPRPASAQLRLVWEAPADCGTEESLRAEVTRLLGRPLPEPLAVEVRGVARRRGAGTWRLRLRTTSQGVRGERVIDAERCEALADAAALILALMIDPSALALHAPELAGASPDPSTRDGRASPEPEEVDSRALPSAFSAAHGAGPGPGAELHPPEVSSPDASPVGAEGDERASVGGAVGARSDARRTDSGGSFLDGPFRTFVGLGGGLDLGSVPSVSGSLSLEGGFGVPRLDARLRATFVFAQNASRDRTSGAAITSAALDARGCARPFDDARFLFGCLGLALGVSVAEGFGLSAIETGVGTFTAAVGGLGLTWAPEPWFDLELDATLFVPFKPLQFAVRGTPDSVFHEQEPVAGRFTASGHVRF